MKILGYILAFLFFFGSAFVGCAGASKALDAAEDLEKATSKLSAQEKELVGALARSAGQELPSTTRLQAGGLLGLVAVLAGLVLVVMTFIRRLPLLPFAIAAVALAAVVIVVYPTVPTGPGDGMAPRPQQIVATVLAAVSAAGALLARRAGSKASTKAVAI
ncbi:MAG TPA: hypothetical protein VM734_34090 [Kofleriaceae bacterium]|nr:hypothetical protein [Kofleriaceae bacterium]